MLQIRLNKDLSAEAGGGPKPLPGETVTVACLDHLILADLPVAKSLGVVTSTSLFKTVGRRSRCQLGERVHFCVRCDFPIAVYRRLSPCEHAFCLDCARSDSICYLCDERIQKIQTIKMMEGIFICAAPHCLKSFLKRSEFESHIHETHDNLLQPNLEKEEGNESEATSVKQSTASESTVFVLHQGQDFLLAQIPSFLIVRINPVASNHLPGQSYSQGHHFLGKSQIIHQSHNLTTAVPQALTDLHLTIASISRALIRRVACSRMPSFQTGNKEFSLRLLILNTLLCITINHQILQCLLLQI